jgi:hypothetical protein
MNNKPVAWTDGKGNYFDKRSFFSVDDLIPLYTHPADESFDRTASHMAGEYVSYPAKTLTDEEIVSLYESSYLESGLDEWEFDPVYFARAILRKAQEK